MLATKQGGASGATLDLPIDQVGTHQVLVTYVASATKAGSVSSATACTVAKASATIGAKLKKMKRHRVKAIITLKAASPIAGKDRCWPPRARRARRSSSRWWARLS